MRGLPEPTPWTPFFKRPRARSRGARAYLRHDDRPPLGPPAPGPPGRHPAGPGRVDRQSCLRRCAHGYGHAGPPVAVAVGRHRSRAPEQPRPRAGRPERAQRARAAPGGAGRRAAPPERPRLRGAREDQPRGLRVFRLPRHPLRHRRPLQRLRLPRLRVGHAGPEGPLQGRSGGTPRAGRALDLPGRPPGRGPGGGEPVPARAVRPEPDRHPSRGAGDGARAAPARRRPQGGRHGPRDRRPARGRGDALARAARDRRREPVRAVQAGPRARHRPAAGPAAPAQRSHAHPRPPRPHGGGGAAAGVRQPRGLEGRAGPRGGGGGLAPLGAGRGPAGAEPGRGLRRHRRDLRWRAQHVHAGRRPARPSLPGRARGGQGPAGGRPAGDPRPQ